MFSPPKEAVLIEDLQRDHAQAAHVSGRICSQDVDGSLSHSCSELTQAPGFVCRCRNTTPRTPCLTIHAFRCRAMHPSIDGAFRPDAVSHGAALQHELCRSADDTATIYKNNLFSAQREVCPTAQYSSDSPAAVDKLDWFASRMLLRRLQPSSSPSCTALDNGRVFWW